VVDSEVLMIVKSFDLFVIKCWGTLLPFLNERRLTAELDALNKCDSLALFQIFRVN